MYPCLKLKKIEERLQYISDFEYPKIVLEQYVTPWHLGSQMLFMMQSQYGDISGKLVADLGSGCGALSIGAAILNASFVVAFELDTDALDLCQQNIAEQEVDNIDLVQCNVTNINDRFNKTFDTVLMNPPFGTKHNSGIDIKFLDTAFRIATKTVYSLHKTSTRDYIYKHAASLGIQAEVLAALSYDLPSTYKFHKKKSVDIEVDFWRFVV